MKRTVAFISIMVLLPLVIYLALPSDKKRIRHLIMEGREAALNKDIDGVMKHVSYNYRDRYGFSYLYLKETFKNLFKRVDSFEIEVDSLRIRVDDKKAEARFNLLVKTRRGNTEGYLIGGEGVPESVVFTLEKEKMKWRIVETYLPTREGIDF